MSESTIHCEVCRDSGYINIFVYRQYGQKGLDRHICCFCNCDSGRAEMDHCAQQIIETGASVDDFISIRADLENYNDERLRDVKYLEEGLYSFV